MKRLLFSISVLTLALAVSPFFAPVASKVNNDPTVVTPETVGLSTNRLAHIRTVMNKHVAEKHIPGASALIARKGKVAYQETFGMADMEAGKPMQMDQSDAGFLLFERESRVLDRIAAYRVRSLNVSLPSTGATESEAERMEAAAVSASF